MSVGSGGVRASMHENSWKFKSQSVISRVIQKHDAQINATLGMLRGRKAEGEAESLNENASWNMMEWSAVAHDKFSLSPGRAEC